MKLQAPNTIGSRLLVIGHWLLRTSPRQRVSVLEYGTAVPLCLEPPVTANTTKPAHWSFIRIWILLLGTCLPAAAQPYITNGFEYAIAGALGGDQVHPQLAINPSGGLLVWEDNITDGDGQGVSALRLDSSLSGLFSTFRVNQIGADDQERPQVALLNGGGAVFVWQGGKRSYQNIFARFLSSSYIWVGGDVMVNTYSATNTTRVNPVVATLANSNVVVAWSSFDQYGTNSLQDIYAQQFSPSGQKIGGEFLVNQFTDFNQRTPSIAPLADGRFVLVWVSEQQSFFNSVDIFARIFNANGTPAASEFIVNTATNICANPSVAPSPSGGFVIAWSEKDSVILTNSWDVLVRPFSSVGVGGAVHYLNSFRFGDQYGPSLRALPDGYMAVWSSMGQDGSWEGVYGTFLDLSGANWGGEFRVNTTTVGGQIHPALASDGVSRFLGVWSSFAGVARGMDLFAQRYADTSQPLSPPGPLFVTVLSSNSLSVSWPPVAGYNVAYYEVYADGSATPTATVTNSWWKMTGLAPNSTHSFQADYVLSNGRPSPLSAPATNTTYGTLTWGGIPYDWMAYYFGSDVFSWPSPYADSDSDGASTLYEFLTGTDPTNPNSVLRMRLQPTKQGLFLNWNTQPGLIYQVQTSADLVSWANLGGPRFAAGALDSFYVGGATMSYYRIIRLR